MAQKKFDLAQAHPWHQRACAYAKETSSWFAVEVGSPEHKAWAEYFQSYGWTPAAFKALAEKGTFTAPCQWPFWLPTNFDADKASKVWPPAPLFKPPLAPPARKPAQEAAE